MATSIREQYEELECQILSPFAVRARDSRGRLREEPKDPIRTDFQRDRDRIIHSKAFRRLKHKTQVFIDPEEDHYRTRLTHTLEVAQIARTIARALRLNEDLTEAIALGHDLGHTPFGHAGEAALDEVIKEFVPSLSFRHSEQSLRVVDFVEKQGEGLNLTYEVRDGILHHSKGNADLSLDTRGPATLEGRVVKIADRVAYINHDIDDAIRAGIITEDDLPRDAVAVVGKVLSKRIGVMVEDIIEQSLPTFRDCGGAGGPSIRMSESVRKATNQLKDFLFAVVYDKDVRGVADLRRASQCLKELFRYYMAHPEEIGDGTWHLGVKDQAELARRVCDFVSGMTDRYAQRDYERKLGLKFAGI